ncbi:hypothetical protein KO361_02650 [Candidatus Woesearchaeota archaeon]|nr:hypothetical protein [Candidatus Woesearchaeota archaeon]
MRRSAKLEKRRKRNNALIGLVLVFLMVFSILAFSLDLSNDQSIIVFNDVSFSQRVIFDDKVFMQELVRFHADLGGDVFLFFSPFEAGLVNVSADLSFLKQADRVLFSRRPVSEEFEFNANLLFFDVLVFEFAEYSFKPAKYGLFSHSVYESDREVINCDSASSSSPVFVLSEEVGSPAILEISPFCFEVVGNGESLLRVSDYLLLSVQGVI